MESVIQIGISSIWETICLWIFVEAFLEKKKKTMFPWKFVLTVGLGSPLIAYLLKWCMPLKFVCILVLEYLLVYFFYEGKIIKKLFVCFSFCFLSITIESVIIGTETVLLPMEFLESVNVWFNIFSQFICKVFLFLFCMVFYSKMHGKKELRFLSMEEWVILCILPCITIVLLGVTFWGFFAKEHMEEILLIVAIGVAFMNPIVFFLMFYVNQRENRMQEQQLEIQKKQNQVSLYEKMRIDYEQQSKIVHDYKNQLSFVQNMLAKSDVTEAVRYIENLSGEITDKTQVVTCHHPVADVIINYKYHDAKRKKISMILKVGDLSKIRVEEYDLVILLSNLIDNAVEACEKVQDKKIIRLEADDENGEFYCKIMNSASEDLVITDGRIESTKKDKLHHGIGLGNVKEIIEKYHGVYSLTYENGEFQFNFSL